MWREMNMPERNDGDGGPGRMSSGDLARKRFQNFQSTQEIAYVETIRTKVKVVLVSIRRLRT
jgi:hypothetical protein